MITSHEPDDDFLSCDICSAYGQCDDHFDPYSDEYEYEDPYDVVMYDIDAEPDDLYALIDMLGDSARSWYARRRLNALAASGSLRALVADIIIDSLGRRWNPLEHPRDRFGRFISTGGFFRWLGRNGKWSRARVERIDSDGVIHARSVGNDDIPDGQLVRFRPEHSSKMVSVADPLADLSNGAEFAEKYAEDLDADIPEFPEATDTQKRIYNALKSGDMPVEDLDRFYISSDETTGTDFANALRDLEGRGLIEIDSSGSRKRARRLDSPETEETEIDDVADGPEDDAPELDDSPELTRQQRDLLDAIAELDRGEGDGVEPQELDADQEDIQALIDADALVETDGVYHLVNPEEGGTEAPTSAEETEAPAGETGEEDIITEILDAADALGDPDSQEAFQHYAVALASPGEEDAFPLPDGISAGRRRNAEQAANRWWNERNGGAPSEEEPTGQRVQDILNPRNQAIADQLASEWLVDEDGNPYDEFLDSDEGVEYRAALKHMLDAADMRDNGFEDQARFEDQRAEKIFQDQSLTDEDIEGWRVEIDRVRSGEAGEEAVPDEVADVPVAEEDDYSFGDADEVDTEAPEAPEAPAEAPEEEEALPEPDIAPEVPEDVPEDVVPEDVADEEAPANPWDEYQRLLDEEGPAETYQERIEQENRLGGAVGIDLVGDDDGRVTWNFMNQMLLGDDEATERLFNDSDGSLGKAAAIYMNNPDAYKSPDADTVDEADATPVDLSDDERSLLEQINNGGQARRSQRELEDQLIDAGLLEEDENGDSRLSDAGRAALGVDTAGQEEVVPEEVVPEDAVPDAGLTDEEFDSALSDFQDRLAGDTDDADVADTVAAAPTLPDPSDPYADTPGFRRTGGQAGLNAGGFYDVLEDNGPLKAGDKVYIKNGRSPEHAQNEVLANRLYNLAGVQVPEIYLGDTNDRIVSKIVDDLEDLDPYDPGQKDVLDRVREEFAVDAWIANWDGANSGNLQVTPDGTPFRIDSGSAMEFRAQGGLKGSAFGDTVDEIDNLRDPSINYESGRIFGPMTNDQIRASVEKVAQVDPAEIEALIAASALPDSDSLAAKMVTRRSNLLQRFGVADPHTPGDTATPTTDTGDTAAEAAPAFPAPTNAQITQAIKRKTPRQAKSLSDFTSRTNPHLEPTYTDGGDLVMADGSVIDFDAFYHTGAGGEGKHGKIVEVLDQEKYPGWVRMEFPDGTDQVRHVLGTGRGGGGLRQSTEEELEDWERQTSVTGDKATDVVDAADFPMSDGQAPLAGTRVVFDVGGEDQFGTLLYFNPKYDNGGRAYIIPEGGGKIYERPVRKIRSQTQDEIDLDASPLVPYQQGVAKAQHLPPPHYGADGVLLSREGAPIKLGDWMSQRSGGDNLVGEVIDIPDQNLYPGWVTLRFPDGEVRVRHVEGFTDINKARGAGGLRHTTAPNMSTWTRQRRVRGEEGEVLSYDFSELETLDGTEINVGQEVFGTDRRGRPISGLLIRINPHLKRNGEVVPTGFILQGNKEIAVDVAKITNTVPPTPTPRPAPPRPPRAVPQTNVPSNIRPSTTTYTPPPSPTITPPRTRPALSSANTPPAYTPGKGRELTDEEMLELEIHSSRSSDRTNGYQFELAAIYEAQDYDGLPAVVDQTEFARLVEEEGYVPILRSVHRGTDPTTNMTYDDAFRYGAYFAGYGIHGFGSYFAYGPWSVSESQGYGGLRIYAAVRPSDLRSIDKGELMKMQSAELTELRGVRRALDRDTDEFKIADRKIAVYSDLGQYAAAKGYDAIIVPGGNGHDEYYTPSDDDLRKQGYLVLLNRGAAVVSDTHFEDRDDIFNTGFPATLAPAVPEEAVVETAETAEAVAPAAPGVV